VFHLRSDLLVRSCQFLSPLASTSTKSFLCLKQTVKLQLQLCNNTVIIVKRYNFIIIWLLKQQRKIVHNCKRKYCRWYVCWIKQGPQFSLLDDARIPSFIIYIFRKKHPKKPVGPSVNLPHLRSIIHLTDATGLKYGPHALCLYKFRGSRIMPKSFSRARAMEILKR
jgi:hypothetical protein